MPYYYVRDRRNVACFRLAERPTWNVSVCCRRNRYLSKAARYFIELAMEYFRREDSGLI